MSETNLDSQVETPVLFIVFNRPDTTEEVFAQIRHARPKRLFIAADGPRPSHPTDAERCRATRDITMRVDWDCEVHRLFRDENLGCKRAVNGAIEWFFEQVSEGIILEDDCVPSLSFFLFCQEILYRYRHDERIMAITGTNLVTVYRIENSYTYSIYGSVWGWATWKRAWRLQDVDMTLWPMAKKRGILRSMLPHETPSAMREEIFDKCHQGITESWAYPWFFSRLVQSGLSIVPRVNLVHNIGFDGRATHTRKSKMRLFSLPRYEIAFPLSHPSFVLPDSEFDRRLFHCHYSVPKRVCALGKRLLLPFHGRRSPRGSECAANSKKWIRFRMIASLALKLVDRIAHIFGGSSGPPTASPKLPRAINFPVTMRCNSRCVMCGVWAAKPEGELSVADIRKLLRQPLFAQVAHIGVSGGEPTMRDDILDVLGAMIESLPRLQGLSLTTNGLAPEKLQPLLGPAKQMCSERGIHFSVNLSMDGIGEVHDRIRGIPGAYERLVKSMHLTKEYHVPVQLQCTVSQSNVYSIGQVRRFALEQRIDCVFRLATNIARLRNDAPIQAVRLTKGQRSFFADFLRDPATAKATRSLNRRVFYRDLASRLVTDLPRKAPCLFMNKGVYIDGKGDVFLCSRAPMIIANALSETAEGNYFGENAHQARQRMITEICPTCYHDQSGEWGLLDYMVVTDTSLRLGAFIGKARAGFRVLGHAPGLLLRKRTITGPVAGKSASNEEVLPQIMKGGRAVLVGCYGGEHVGDAAILGGVLMRLNREFGVSDAVVASFRPDRTQRWVDCLQTDVKVEVIPYEQRVLAQALDNGASCFVVAGGPLMDLPDLLVRHLLGAEYAWKRGTPILIESVGIGPLRQRLCHTLVKRLLRMAVRVRTRTRKGMEEVNSWGLRAELMRDPAFDYLESRETAAGDGIPMSLAGILDTSKPIIALNLRSLWRKYATSRSAGLNLEKIERNFLNHLSRAMMARASQARFVFFPMNTDQYGFSDLNVAYTLQSILPESMDFHIWEYEPDIDQVTSLLKSVRGCVSMRFHGCIFALSTGTPTIGIDYGIGQMSKVGELFDDSNLSRRLINVCEADTERLGNALDDLLR